MVAALAIGGGVTLFIINYNTDSTGKAQILDDGQNIYVVAPATEGYQGYRFKFKSGKTTFSVDNDSNILDLSTVTQVELGNDYQISVCYLGETEGGNSRYGQSVTWRAQAYLDKPVLNCTDGKLSWDEVKNASYYVVHYGTNTFMTDKTEVNLSESELVGGQFDIVVSAHSNASFYLLSTSACLENQTIKHKFADFSKIKPNFTSSSKQVILTGSEKLSLIKVYVGANSYEFSNFTISQEQGNYIYTLDISFIYLPNQTIGASAAKIDDYNIESNIIYLT